jgi:DNA-directed RNA polymerase specialized sigma24 family protein
MNLEEELRSNEMGEIIDGMTAYAYNRIKTIEEKDLQGKTPDDFVAEVLMKVVENDRDWNKAKCSFKEFLFGALKSHISNFFTTFKSAHNNNLPELAAPEESTAISTTELKSTALEMLQNEGAKDDELEIFDCWTDGVLKPSEVAKQLGKSVESIYNSTKRLVRKLPLLKEKFKKLL